MPDATPQTSQEVWKEEPRGGYPDPSVLALSGLERLQEWGRQRAPAPPLSRLTGSRIGQVGDGVASADVPATEWLMNSAGVIGGGTLAIVADIAFGCAIQTKLPSAIPYTTAELSMTFLRPVRPPGSLTAGGQAIHVGGTVALSEVFLIDDDTEDLVAHGTSRCAILPAIEGLAEPPDERPIVELDGNEDTDPYLRPPPDGAVLGQEIWDELSGFQILERQLRGDLPAPPISQLTGMRPTEFSEGAATVVLPCTKWLTSPATTVQGGVTAMLADTAMMLAMQSTSPAGTAVAGLDLKVNYLRPVMPDGRDLTARAQLRHSGRTIAVTEAVVENADGKTVALATGSSMYLPGRPATLGEAELAAGPDAEDQ